MSMVTMVTRRCQLNTVDAGALNHRLESYLDSLVIMGTAGLTQGVTARLRRRP